MNTLLLKKTSIISLLLSLFISQAMASNIAELTCSFTNQSVKGAFIIAMSDLSSPEKSDLAEVYTDYEGQQTAFSFDGNQDMEWYWQLLMSWDNGYKFDQDGNFVLLLDSDGCDVGVLKIYRNNGFRYGYTRVEHRCSGDFPDTYSPVNCQVDTK